MDRTTGYANDGALLAASGDYGTFPEVFDLEAETEEILRLKQDAGKAVLEMGQRLIRVKEHLEHGRWLAWLSESVEFSERSAQNLMRLSREWSNPQTLADLGSSKAFVLLALPADEREAFLAENHVVGGEEKNVQEMSVRELAQAIRERDEARRELETEKSNAAHAEESRAEMEREMRALKQTHEGTLAELQELRERPVDVAVEKVVDEEAVAKAVAEAEKRVQKKADKELGAAMKEAGQAKLDLKAAQRELEELRERLKMAEEEVREAVAAPAPAPTEGASGDKELAMFEVLFNQVQGEVNQLHGLLLKVRQRDGGRELSDKLVRALLALSEAVKGVASA